ncbi:MAG: hypothetical protein KQH79_11255 [Bacteroidetes bacterium]|nr:hypothetical protein [Bacteroidota bacterium]
MKNLLYVIAALLIIIWGIIVISFDTSATVHVILLIAGIVILIRYLQKKKQVN